MIFAIDPGNTESAYVVCSEGGKTLLKFDKIENHKMLDIVRMYGGQNFAIEMVASYGMPVGKDVFETCVWAGRFAQAAVDAGHDEPQQIYRKEVKLHLCGSLRAKDSNIRQAILDLFEPSGGGKTPQVGTKKEPGPLYGVSKDVWAALGVALTYAEQLK